MHPVKLKLNFMRYKGRLHYAWIIVAITFTATIMVAGVRATPSVLIVPFEQEFHWSRATISLAIGINLLLYGAVGDGGVTYFALGHCHNPAIRAGRATDPGDTTPPAFRGSWESPNFITLLRNAIAWGAGV